MEKNRKTAILCYLAAALCYVCSVIWFCIGKGGLGALWLCIGSVNMSLGTARMKRSGDSENPDKQEDNE